MSKGLARTAISVQCRPASHAPCPDATFKRHRLPEDELSAAPDASASLSGAAGADASAGAQTCGGPPAAEKHWSLSMRSMLRQSSSRMPLQRSIYDFGTLIILSFSCCQLPNLSGLCVSP